MQDTDFSGSDDATVLAWAAEEERVLLTHDINTVPPSAYDRVMAGLPMPGVFVVPTRLSIGEAIEDLLLIAECSVEGEWQGQVRYLPLS